MRGPAPRRHPSVSGTAAWRPHGDTGRQKATVSTQHNEHDDDACADSPTVGSHPRMQGHKRCALHHKQRTKWNKRNAKRRERDGPGARQDPWEPHAIDRIPGVHLTAQDVDFLDDLRRDVLDARSTVEGRALQRGAPVPRQVQDLLDRLTVLDNGLKEALHPED